MDKTIMNEKNQEKLSLIIKVFINWVIKENTNKVTTDTTSDITLVEILKKKIEVFKINVIIPDELGMILALCSGNPGFIQLMFCEMLKTIKETKFAGESIKSGYVVTTTDFINTFGNEFPAVDIFQWRRDEYEKKWEAQKINKRDVFGSDNSIDYPDYWKEYVTV